MDRYGKRVEPLLLGVNNPQKNSGAGRDRLTLSGPVKLTQRIVMTIASAAPEYWRGASYDVWTGKEWITSDRSPVTRTDKQPVIAGRFTRREKITADITIQQSKSDLLYLPDEPTTLSVSYRMYAHHLTRRCGFQRHPGTQTRDPKPSVPS